MKNYVFMCAAGGAVDDRFRCGGHCLEVFNYSNNLCNEGKWKNIYQMLRACHPQPDDYFWFPDPDLEFPDGTIDRLFSVARDHKLDLSQPALTTDSICSHRHLVWNGHGPSVTEVPFVEIMCPVFSAPALFRNCWTFNLNYSGYGVDFLWGRKEKCHLIHSVTVKHPEAPHYEQTARQWGFPDPSLELIELKRRFRL